MNFNYFDLYKEVWNFHKKFHEVKDTDEYWEAVIDEADTIARKYGNSIFVRALLLDVINELERIYKANKAA